MLAGVIIGKYTQSVLSHKLPAVVAETVFLSPSVFQPLQRDPFLDLNLFSLSWKIQKVIKEKKVSYPVWQDTTKPSAFETFKLKSVPTLFLIDQKRQIVAQWASKADHKAIEKQIQVLLNKK